MRRAFWICGFLLTLAACGGSSAPTPLPTPNATSTLVSVLSSGGLPEVNLAVTLSTGISGNAPKGSIATRDTNADGQVTFSPLPSTGQLCVSATTNGAFVSQCLQPFPRAITLHFSHIK
jgi:hypothetical protein